MKKVHIGRGNYNLVMVLDGDMCSIAQIHQSGEESPSIGGWLPEDEDRLRLACGSPEDGELSFDELLQKINLIF